MTNKIFKTGHSAVVALSPKILKSLGLDIGDTVRIETDSSKEAIVISKSKKHDQLSLGLKVRPKLK